MSQIKPTPLQQFGELFEALHQSGLWPDGKVLSDSVPKSDPESILETFREERGNPDFDLENFFETQFDYPSSPTSGFEADPSRPVEEHIELLWEILQRKADEDVPGSSLLPLPHPYIVPGGRFNEIYYWDSSSACSMMRRKRPLNPEKFLPDWVYSTQIA